jgi:hypothetical protein
MGPFGTKRLPEKIQKRSFEFVTLVPLRSLSGTSENLQKFEIPMPAGDYTL